MVKLTKGNYPAKDVEIEGPEKHEFEEEVVKHLGASHAIVRRGKKVYDSNE